MRASNVSKVDQGRLIMCPVASSGTSQNGDDSTLELLSLIRTLISETGTSRATVPISLDVSLERDLDLDSLARVELVARVETHFGVVLPEGVFAEAETPRDLLQALRTASGARQLLPVMPAGEIDLGEVRDVPRSEQTLLDVLDWHIEAHGDRPHIEFYADSGAGRRLTYQQLYDGAAAIAGALQNKGVEPGHTVALILPTSEDYFLCFFGILMAGAVPVPIYPPARPSQMEDHLRRHTGILNNCQPQVLIADAKTTHVARWLRSAVSSLRHLVTAEALRQAGEPHEPPAIGPDDVAFLQYTSGSTGQPKGVVLSHANLLANIRAMGDWVGADSDDVFVSWLPLYHDMGLIGAWLGSLYYAMFFVVMTPLSFLAAPSRWLWAMHRYGGTLSASPNFGFELCLSRIDDDRLEGLDLSRWRAAFNGAEAVSPATLERFCDRFAAYGFARSAMMPVYGLAENSVGLAFPPPGREPVIDIIERDTFTRSGRAVPAHRDSRVIRFPACGYALTGHEIRVVDETGTEVPDRQQGRIQFRGPSATRGYYRSPVKTRELFDGDWRNTGDLGYTVEGEVYVTGRSKDVIIRGGRNIYPEELEEAIGDVDGIRKGRAAVFGSVDARTGTERLVILAETREEDSGRREQLRRRISELTLERLDMPPDDIVLAPPGSLLKTSSGKIRRSTIRERYEKGEADRAPPSVWRQWVRVQFMGVKPSLTRLRHRVAVDGYSGYAWACYGLLAPFVLAALFLLPNLRWRWQVMREIGRILARMTATPVAVSGIGLLPKAGAPCVLVANHQSYLDPYVLITVMPAPLSFVAKAELAHKLSTGPALRRMGCLFVERFDAAKGSADAQALTDAARAGRSLAFFPEGTFTRIPGLRPFHMGAFVTAVDADLPVVPVVIRGTRQMLRGDSWFPRRGRLSVAIGPPIDPGQMREPGETTWHTALKVRDEARSFIAARDGEPDLVA